MWPRRPLAALLLACAALAACGGDAEQENAYVDAVGVAQRTYVDRFDQIRTRLTATSTLDQDRQTLADFGEATERFVTTLKRVDRPGRVIDEHEQLVGALQRYERRVEAASKRLAGGSSAERAKVRTELSTSVVKTQEEVVAAIAAINKALRA
jgi:hypothetical protein